MSAIRWLLAVVIIAAGVALFGAAITVGGRGYFSPDTLQTRTQSESYVHWSAFGYHRSELVSFLVDEGYWTAIQSDNPRWFEIFHWNRRWRGGSTTFSREFGSWGRRWIEWTKSHRDIAAILWPRALKMLRSPEESREHCPTELMRLAEHASSVDEFKRELAANGIDL